MKTFKFLTALAFIYLGCAVNSFAQNTVLQAGTFTAGHAPMYVSSGGGSQPIIQDSGTAAGGNSGLGLSELALTLRAYGQTPPFSNAGTGPNYSNFCDYDAPTTNATGYHYFCISPNTGGAGVISYGAVGAATPQPLYFNINGNSVNISNITPGGTAGQIQYNTGTGFGGFTVDGDGTLNTSTGSLIVTKTNGIPLTSAATTNIGTSGATIPLNNGNNVFSGNNNFTGTTFEIGSVVQNFPTSGLIVGQTDTQILSNKTLTSPQISGSSTGTTTIANANSSATNYTATIPAGTGYILESTSSVPIVTGTPSSSTFLRGDGTWSAPAGSGNVTGPGSAVSGNFASFSGTSGTIIQDSGKSAASFGNVTNTGASIVNQIPAYTSTAGTAVSPVFLPTAPGNFQALVIQVTGNTAIAASANSVSMTNASGLGFTAALSSTINASTTGINALDTGTLSANSWYYVYAVSNGITTGAVISLSSSSPNSAITTTYPYYVRIGAVHTSTGSAVLLATLQKGRQSQYVVGGVNVANLPIMASGAAGNISTPTYVPVSVSSYVPTTASKIKFAAAFTAGGTVTMVVPNNSYGAYSSGTNPPLYVNSTGTGADSTSRVYPGEFELESTNIYWAQQLPSGTGLLLCIGWEDNL